MLSCHHMPECIINFIKAKESLQLLVCLHVTANVLLLLYCWDL